MSASVARPGPGRGAAALEQVSVVGLGRRRELIGFLVVVLGMMTLGLVQVYRTLPVVEARMLGMEGLQPAEAVRAAHAHVGSMFVMSLAVFATLAVLIGAGWAMRVWTGEGPSRRGYHWSMPVDRRLHEVLRVGAGAIWLILLVTTVLAAGLIMASIAAAGAILPWQVLTPGTWLAAMAGPLAAYLVISAVALRSDHPGYWVAGTVFGYLVLRGVTSAFGPDWLYQSLIALVEGHLGLRRLFEPAFLLAVRAMEAPGIQEFREALHLPSTVDMNFWMPGVLFWLGLGLVAVMVATFAQRTR